MPSPFPGMNPYIEQDAFWQDFHLEFLPAIRGRLVAQVRPKYIVMLDEHIYVQEHAPGPRRLVGRADVSLAVPPRPRDEEAAGVEILDAPVQVQIPAQEVRRVPFLEVRDRLGRELITVVELLSPTNKRGGADREQYVAKREQLLKTAAHFVEIDLLRGGRPMPVERRPQVRLLRPGQSGRGSALGGLLAGPVAPSPADHPDPAALGRSGRPDRSPGDPPSRLRRDRLRGFHLCQPARSDALFQGCRLGPGVRAVDTLSAGRLAIRRRRRPGEIPRFGRAWSGSFVATKVLGITPQRGECADRLPGEGGRSCSGIAKKSVLNAGISSSGKALWPIPVGWVKPTGGRPRWVSPTLQDAYQDRLFGQRMAASGSRGEHVGREPS